MTTNAEFKKATVRIFGLFDQETIEWIAKKPDVSGNLVVSIYDDKIVVAFDRQDVIYIAPIIRRP